MIEVVIIIQNERFISVSYEAPQKGDTAYFRGTGIVVYVRRAKKGLKAPYERIRNQALNVAHAHNIPMLSFYDCRPTRASGKKAKPVSPKQKALF